jgi:ClpP class serine protease
MINKYWLSIPEYIETYQKIISGENKCKTKSQSIGSFRLASSESYIIPITGILVPDEEEAKMIRSFGIQSTSYESIKQSLFIAENDKDIKNVTLIINSGGGYVSGIDTLSQELVNFRDKKPIYTYIDSLCASAAYWIASISHEIAASSLSEIGSIGAFTSVEDTSKMADNLGIKVHLIRSAPLKGTGTPGVAIDEKEIESRQELINSIGLEFQNMVKMFRGHIKEDVFDARLLLANDSVEAGLIDLVSNDVIQYIATLNGGNNMIANDLKNKMTSLSKEMSIKLVEDVEDEEEVQEDEEQEEECQEDAPEEDEDEAVEDEDEEEDEEMQEEDEEEEDEEMQEEDEEEDVEAMAIYDERKRCLDILNTFSSYSVKFALSCIEDGLSIYESKSKAFDEKIFEKKSKGAKKVEKTISINTNGGPQKGEHLAISKAKSIAREKGVSLLQAMNILKKTDPELVSAYYGGNVK